MQKIWHHSHPKYLGVHGAVAGPSVMFWLFFSMATYCVFDKYMCVSKINMCGKHCVRDKYTMLATTTTAIIGLLSMVFLLCWGCARVRRWTGAWLVRPRRIFSTTPRMTGQTRLPDTRGRRWRRRRPAPRRQRFRLVGCKSLGGVLLVGRCATGGAVSVGVADEVPQGAAAAVGGSAWWQRAACATEEEARLRHMRSRPVSIRLLAANTRTQLDLPSVFNMRRAQSEAELCGVLPRSHEQGRLTPSRRSAPRGNGILAAPGAAHARDAEVWCAWHTGGVGAERSFTISGQAAFSLEVD